MAETPVFHTASPPKGFLDPREVAREVINDIAAQGHSLERFQDGLQGLLQTLVQPPDKEL